MLDQGASLAGPLDKFLPDSSGPVRKDLFERDLGEGRKLEPTTDNPKDTKGPASKRQPAPIPGVGAHAALIVAHLRMLQLLPEYLHFPQELRGPRRMSCMLLSTFCTSTPRKNCCSILMCAHRVKGGSLPGIPGSLNEIRNSSGPPI